MARSMTAFGRAGATVNGKEILVEIRSVNNRYLDTTVKISRAYSALEERAKTYLSSGGVSRGKVDLVISVNLLENKVGQVMLDRAYAESYIAALRQLQSEFGLYDDISTMRVASNRDLFVFSHGEEDEEQAWQDIVTGFEPALAMFIERRKIEGENLKKDLLLKKAELVALTAKVEEKAASYTETYRQKLETRLKNVLADQKIVLDESRILTECAIFADSFITSPSEPVSSIFPVPSRAATSILSISPPSSVYASPLTVPISLYSSIVSGVNFFSPRYLEIFSELTVTDFTLSLIISCAAFLQREAIVRSRLRTPASRV